MQSFFIYYITINENKMRLYKGFKRKDLAKELLLKASEQIILKLVNNIGHKFYPYC